MATSLANFFYSPQSNGPWRPPQWQQPAMFMVTISGSQNAPAPQSNVGSAEDIAAGAGVFQVNGTTTQIYVFDAVMQADHRQDARITEFPVQTGANISDHAYIMPAEITLDIGMSDAMQAFAAANNAAMNVEQNDALQAGQWTAPQLSGAWGAGSASSPIMKSVNAYQTLLSWEANRVLLSLTTRLVTYNTAMVASVNPVEKADTIAGLRCRVVFKQVFLASTQTINSSARPQDTQNNSQGQVTGVDPSAAQTSQYGGQSGSTVLGAGDWSSNPSAVTDAP